MSKLGHDVEFVLADTLREERPKGLTAEGSWEWGSVSVAKLKTEGSKKSIDDGSFDGESHGKNSNHKGQELQKKGSEELSKDDSGGRSSFLQMLF